MTKHELVLLSDESLHTLIATMDISLNHPEWCSRDSYRKYTKLQEKAIQEARRRKEKEKP